MKIVIVSDIHANLAALEALPEREFDHLWCICQGRSKSRPLGRSKRFSVDPMCSPSFKRLAAETLRFTREVCTEDDFAFLRALPEHYEIETDSTRFYLVHACPTDPLFGYCPEHSDRWVEEVARIDADVLIVGHTHTPFIRSIGKTTIVNPGSLGQPKTGRPLACYAVWEDGTISLKEYPYPLRETAEQIRLMPISNNDQDALISVLETGALPTEGH